MYRTVAMLLMLALGMILGQEPIAQRSTILVNTVKRGDLVQMVRGLGVFKAERTAEVNLPEAAARTVKAGQKAVVDTRNGIVGGHVARVGSAVANGTATVEIQLDGKPPQGAIRGLNVDVTIHVFTLTDVIYVGGPANRLSELSEQTGTIFRLDRDGQHAVRTPVEFGLTGRSTAEIRFDKVIEIRSGLRPRDEVILSDMSAFKDRERVGLQ